ncbi:subtilisin-like protease SBT3.18 [Syzygium oleosum]|uniref:subtilisin-like protease SBT3.18 n=1 Tax=Syzygium oleosum TaxID=219896 RepID=UPI0011D24E64|nr:subtilisin-like protease SBT3.18 [Syzygium oleosum]
MENINMEEHYAHDLHSFWSLLLSLSFFFIYSTCSSEPEVHIVYLGHSAQHDHQLTSGLHQQLLLNVFESEEEAAQSKIYSYTYGFSGFAAKLTPDQAATIARKEGVVSVFRSKILKLDTTRSWDFMGLPLQETPDNDEAPHGAVSSTFGDDVIVGVIDSGIWPESASFREEPWMGPIPRTWKGECMSGQDFPSTTCNRKLIGARYYVAGLEQELGPLDTSSGTEYCSPRDRLGHGTHTASTAVGSIVHNVNFFGLGSGTARGGAPRARLAVYKVCWNKTGDSAGECSEADILAAFEGALKDGVHIISASISTTIGQLLPFFNWSADIGSFHAMQKGVTVVFSAGNYEYSPDPSRVKNVAPWSISVAASTIDRSFPTQMVFDNNLTVMGQSMITTEVYALLIDAGLFFSNGACLREGWNNRPAAGKVILCFSTMGFITSAEAAAAVKKAGGSGLIFVEPLGRQVPYVDVVPTVYIDIYQGTKLLHYLGSSEWLPTVKITPAKSLVGKVPAPEVAFFSCRGPSALSPDILKPDLSAPGVNILAAWPPKTPPTLSPSDKRSVNWSFQSGTSMSCPHVTGTAALVKSAHPDWSPAAIRSALMTTAYTKDTKSEYFLSGGSTKPSDPFDIGAGHINPTKAIDPGLVYDMKAGDYVIFLCNIGYTQEQIAKVVRPGTNHTCPRVHTSNSNLNYPSITVSDLQTTMTIRRTVRNVGWNRNAVYTPRVVSPSGVDVAIWPRLLVFSHYKDENTYYVTLNPRKKSEGRYDFGEVVWSDGFHTVRSPLTVCVNNIGDGTESMSYTTDI